MFSAGKQSFPFRSLSYPFIRGNGLLLPLKCIGRCHPSWGNCSFLVEVQFRCGLYSSWIVCPQLPSEDQLALADVGFSAVVPLAPADKDPAKFCYTLNKPTCSPVRGSSMEW